jgi:hypothetical protein
MTGAHRSAGRDGDIVYSQRLNASLAAAPTMPGSFVSGMMTVFSGGK